MLIFCFQPCPVPVRYDKQLQQIDGTLSTIEMQREALEGANTNTAVLTTMNDAAKALKKANADLDVDKVGFLANTNKIIIFFINIYFRSMI